MEDIIIILMIAGVITGALIYLLKAKKRGEKCVGCPYSKNCSMKCGCTDLKEKDK